MRKKRNLETDEQRAERVKKQAQTRVDDKAAAERAIDAMVERNVKLHGP